MSQILIMSFVNRSHKREIEGDDELRDRVKKYQFYLEKELAASTRIDFKVNRK